MSLVFNGMSIVRLGLVEGRHEITSNDGEKVTQFIFQNQINDPNDFTTMERHCFNFIEGVFLNERESQGMVLTLEIYVTGLTQALTSTLIAMKKAISEWDAWHTTNVYLMHFNRDTGGYEKQVWLH